MKPFTLRSYLEGMTDKQLNRLFVRILDRTNVHWDWRRLRYTHRQSYRVVNMIARISMERADVRGETFVLMGV